MNRLQGKRLLITGGTTGIGLETAKQFLLEGARVVITGQNPDTLAQAQQELGKEVIVSVYSVSKAAMISLAKTLSGELIERGIRVNAVSPGPIATPILGKSGLPPEAILQVAEMLRCQIPLKRFGDPIEIAKAVVFLISDESSFMLGSEMIIDGGTSTL